MDNVTRAQIGHRVAGISVATNAILGIVKVVLGLLSGSIGLLADAFHSLSDAGTSLVLLIGFRIAAKPPDRRHPFGHGRAEHMATFILAVILGIAAFEFFKNSLQRVFTPPLLDIPGWVLAALLGTVAVKEALFFYTMRQAKRIDSEALRADAWHHRSDSLSTLLVIGGLGASHLGWLWVDPVAGMAVGVLIAVLSVQLLRRSSSHLLGEAPTKEEVRRIKEEACRAQGVLGAHEVIVHRYGASRWISLHVEVPERLTAGELHTIADAVERRLEERGYESVVVHADPVSEHHPLLPRVRELTEGFVAGAQNVITFQDLRIIGGATGPARMVVDLFVQPGMSKTETETLRRDFSRQARGAFPDLTVQVVFRPAMSAEC